MSIFQGPKCFVLSLTSFFQNIKSAWWVWTTRARRRSSTSSWWTRWCTHRPPSAATWRRSSGTTSTSSCGTWGGRSHYELHGTLTTPTRSSSSWLWTPQIGRGWQSPRRSFTKCFNQTSCVKRQCWYLPTSRYFRDFCFLVLIVECKLQVFATFILIMWFHKRKGLFCSLVKHFMRKNNFMCYLILDHTARNWKFWSWRKYEYYPLNNTAALLGCRGMYDGSRNLEAVKSSESEESQVANPILLCAHRRGVMTLNWIIIDQYHLTLIVVISSFYVWWQTST